MSAKDAETMATGVTCDMAVNVAQQLEELYFGTNSKKIPVIIFTDHLGMLESVASTHEVERRVMRQHVYGLKRNLQMGKIEAYAWVQSEEQLADVMTKEKVSTEMLDGVVDKNRCYQVISRDNMVRWLDNEMDVSGRRLRAVVAAKPNKSMIKKKKVKN